MLTIRELFEAHLTVANLNRAMKFYGNVLGLELAIHLAERRGAFYWLGGKLMLGLWETGSGPQRVQLHTAFRMEFQDLLEVVGKLKAMNITPRDLESQPIDEPAVLAWTSAATVYFDDPDGNQLEFIAMLPDEPQPKLGIVRWSEWKNR